MDITPKQANKSSSLIKATDDSRETQIAFIGMTALILPGTGDLSIRKRWIYRFGRLNVRSSKRIAETREKNTIWRYSNAKKNRPNPSWPFQRHGFPPD
ncbi:hypothetical protein V3O24_04170 [Methylobacter sp. Wu8]